MTSLKQIEANRRNVHRSTGPRTEEGKQNASRNAFRHGLTAETVVEPLEDPEDYKAFEQAIAADYNAESAVERELVLRLACLLWRLRRATSIETGLLSIDDEILSECEQGREPESTPRYRTPSGLFRLRKPVTNEQVKDDWNDLGGNRHAFEHKRIDVDGNSVSPVPSVQNNIANRFLRVANLRDGVFERLSRYEMMLWRQVRQTLFTLEAMRWRSLTARRPGHDFWRRTHDRNAD